MVKMSIVAFATGLLMCACGRGGGGGDGINPVVASHRPVLIEAYGDSTTVGCTPTQGAPGATICSIAGGYTVASPTEPQALQALLQTALGSTVTVSNKGVSGITADELLNGTGYENGQTWQSSMSASKAQIVTLNLGLNDARLTNENFLADLQEIVTIARTRGKTIVLYTPNPELTGNPQVDQNLVLIRNEILQMAQAMNVPVVDDYSALTLAQWQTLLPDGIHPIATGYQIKANYESQAVQAIVKPFL
jgi:acyl-CoA thioesterase-1